MRWDPPGAGSAPPLSSLHTVAGMPIGRLTVALGRPKAVLALALALASPATLGAQSKATVLAEREAFIRWMAQATLSPAGAVAMAPLKDGVTLGPGDAEIPLTDLPPVTVRPRGPGLRLDSAGTTRPIPRYRPVAVGPYSFYISGQGDRTTLIVYRPDAAAEASPPTFYPYRADLDRTVTLDRQGAGTAVRMLALDGLEVEAFTAGTVTVPDGGGTATLAVRLVPNPATEESELQIYFRDGTSGAGSYPAGRFVSLTPLGGDRYRLDFNTARNPFCAYSTVYPCPVPWRGNRLSTDVAAGEAYHGNDVAPAEEGS